MAIVVKKTSPVESEMTAAFSAFTSCQESFYEAVNSNGGRNIRNTVSGFRSTSGSCGVKPITSPATTNIMD